MELRESTVRLDDGTELYVRMHDGDSLPIVLLHDLDCSSRYWDPVMTRLLELDPQLHIVALDLRGHGRSTATGETSRKRLVNDVKRACRLLGLDDPVLCGHGWGADIALAADFASSVVAINPLFGREPGAFPEDCPRPPGMPGAGSATVLESCRVGAANAKSLRRSRRDAPLLLIASDPADTGADAYPGIADAALASYCWQEGSRQLPLEAPAGIAALVLAWIEEVA